MKQDQKCFKLLEKIILQADLQLLSGLHIGTTDDFSPIGMVDSFVVRDTVSGQPIIPGSSLKGKMRSLLARTECSGYVLDDFKNDSPALKRLFGASLPDIIQSRLQFYDVFMTPQSIEKISGKNTDLYLTEVKFENSISRITAVANPRQIERVPRGAEFTFRLVYNIEDDGGDVAASVASDFQILKKGLLLLQADYIGGSGSRGYGKISFNNITLRLAGISDGQYQPDLTSLQKIMEGAQYDALLRN